MSERPNPAATRLDRERARWLEQYEKLSCRICGQPLKLYLAHYPRRAHVRCLLKKCRKSVPASFWLSKV